MDQRQSAGEKVRRTGRRTLPLLHSLNNTHSLQHFVNRSVRQARSSWKRNQNVLTLTPMKNVTPA